MRIGILTQPLLANYGGILQAYALQTVLKRMGHKVVTFDDPRYLKIDICQIVKRAYQRYVHKKANTGILNEVRFNRDACFIRKYTQPFINRNISRKIVRNFSELSESDYDAIVVGSDQVWRPMYNACIEDMYLDFARHWSVKRLAYAASFGSSEWEYTESQTNVCSELVKVFDAVSVREDSGVGICSRYLGYDKAIHLLDPTMLLEAKDYELLVVSSHSACRNSCNKGGLFCYILDETEEKNMLANLMATRQGLEYFKVGAKTDDVHAKMKDRIQPPVERWLRAFMDAEYVLTDSFHGCVFSIIFNKPFWVIGNKGRGMARFDSLLKMFGLEDRLLSKYDDIKNVDFSKPIDWGSVNRIKKDWQEKSYTFLNSNLSVV